MKFYFYYVCVYCIWRSGHTCIVCGHQSPDKSKLDNHIQTTGHILTRAVFDTELVTTGRVLNRHIDAVLSAWIMNIRWCISNRIVTVQHIGSKLILSNRAITYWSLIDHLSISNHSYWLIDFMLASIAHYYFFHDKEGYGVRLTSAVSMCVDFSPTFLYNFQEISLRSGQLPPILYRVIYEFHRTKHCWQCWYRRCDVGGECTVQTKILIIYYLTTWKKVYFRIAIFVLQATSRQRTFSACVLSAVVFHYPSIGVGISTICYCNRRK